MLRNNGRHNFRSSFGIQPSLILDFANTNSLDSRITFTRSTTATYTNSNGVLTTAPINQPRFDFNPTTGESLGLLIEQSSTNLLTYSQDFSNAVWPKPNATIIANANIAPDGTQTAQLLVESTSSTSHGFYSTVFNIQTNGQLYTQSIYVKSKERTWIVLEPSYTTTTPTTTAYFNIGTGAIGTLTNCTATITSVGNGWYRCTVTYTATVTRPNIIGGVYLATGDGGVIYTGNGYSGLYVWQNQFENLAFATSPIATTSAQVTRASDNATMTGTNFSSWYNNQGQGSFFMDFDIGYYVSGVGGNNQGLACFGTSGNRILSYVGNIATRPITGQLYDGTTNITQVLNAGGNLTINQSIKVAFTFNTTTLTGTYNGLTPNSNTGSTLALSIVILYLGYKFDTTNYLNGHIKKFAYYPQAVTSAQLQALTGS